MLSGPTVRKCVFYCLFLTTVPNISCHTLLAIELTVLQKDTESLQSVSEEVAFVESACALNKKIVNDRK